MPESAAGAQLNVAEELQEAMGMTASQVMQEHSRGMLASLIGKVVAVAPEEEEDQVEVFRSIGNALLQNMSGVGSTSSSVASSISGRYRGEIRGSGYGVGMTEDQLTALLQEVKKSSYVTMCQVIESRNAVDMVGQRVARIFREWMMADRLNGLTEETRAIAKRTESDPVVWVTKSRIVAAGKAESKVVDFEGKA